MPKPETESVSSSGITVNALTGERHIPASVRPDGSQRREIKIRPGYRPPEDVQVYKNRTAEAWKNRGKGIPGAEGSKEESTDSTTATAASNKNAKKREAKRRAKAAEGENAMTTTSGKTEGAITGKAMGKDNWRERREEEKPSVGTDTVLDVEAEKEKKARNLRKKLRQARELREKKDNGENLLPEQFEKVIKIQELVRQLDALGFDSEGEKKKTSGDQNP